MNSQSTDSIGIVVTGLDSERSFHFFGAIGLDLETDSLSFITATGAPDDDRFSSIDPASSPKKFRQEILDLVFELKKDKKQFYADSAQNELNRLFEEHFEEIADLVRSNSTDKELQKFLSSRFKKFRASEINVSTVEFEELVFDDEESSDETDEEIESENFDTEVETEESVMEVNPIIDVENGKSVGSLESGEEIVVKIPRESRNRSTSRGSKNRSTQSAAFVEFSPSGSEEGTLLVHLDEDLYGWANVSMGSLLKLSPGESEPGSLEQYLKTFFGILLFTLGILLVVFLVIIFLSP